jgi:hypothetical protein
MKSPASIPNAKTKLKYGQFVAYSIQGRPARVGVVMKVTESGSFCTVQVYFHDGVGVVSADFLKPTKRRIGLPMAAWTLIRETAANDRTRRIMAGVFPVAT